MEIKYLQNLYIESQRIFSNFKRENVLNSATLREMFSPKYVYKGGKPNTVLVKSRVTNQPVEITWEKVEKQLKNELSYEFSFYNTDKKIIGHKYFYIEDFHLPNRAEKEMLAGYMNSTANDLYSGIGVREEELQIKTALNSNIDCIPRSAIGPATLYHTKMGYLPVTTPDDLIEVKNEFDVNRYMNGMLKKSPDIKKENFRPIIVKDNSTYYIDINKTLAVANVKEIKERLANGETKKEIDFLQIEGIPMSLSGNELAYWKNLIKQN